MEIYILAVILFFIVSIAEINVTNAFTLKITRRFLLIPMGFIILLVGLRWEMGTDWEAYFTIYKYLDKNSLDISMEKGFVYLNYFFKSMGISYQMFIFIQTFFFFFYLTAFYKKITAFPALALLWFFTTNLGIIGANRQLIAMGIVCAGLLYYLKNKKWYVYLFFIILALQFHTSSFFAVFYLFFNRKIDTKFLLSGIIISAFLGMIGVFSFITPYIYVFGELAANKANAYSSEVTDYSSLAIIKRLIIVLPCLLYRKKIENLKYFNLILNSYIFGICLYLIFGKTLGIVATRGAFYFNIMEPVIITSYLIIFRNFMSKNIYILIITILSFFMMKNSIKQYPEIFVPYKTQFFETDLINY